MSGAAPIPLALYVHLPWCVRKCPYCDFNSHETGTLRIPEAEYVDALLRDLELEAPALAGRPLVSIFFGGGTPSLFSAGGMTRLLRGLRDNLAIPDGIEITLEANPGTVEAARFEAYRNAGINRLSLGMQSLDDAALGRLGRIHGGAEALQAFRVARAAGFSNINLDFMYGLPEQAVADAMHDLEGALALAPEHLSWYQLTLEPNTVFHSRPPPLPDEDSTWEMQQAGLALLQQAGYARYEVSAFAREQRRCLHNLNYWEFGDYLGLGAGAHGKLTLAGCVHRYARHRLPAAYMQRAGSARAIVTHAEPGPEDLVLEFMLNACRLTAGFDLSLFAARTGLSGAVLTRSMQAPIDAGLISIGGGRVKPTERGQHYLNDLLQYFLPETAGPRRAQA